MIENKKEFKLISKKNPRSLLPNALTIFGVCLGLSSIKFALDANYAMSVIAIAFAAILDTLDGRVARLVKGTSKVGKELDSLTDVISFGVAPSFIMYFWTINELGKIGWMIVLIYIVCCALRLARFNLTVIEETETWKINFFEGVPSPAAAGLILLPLILHLSDLFQFENNAIIRLKYSELTIKILNNVYIFLQNNQNVIAYEYLSLLSEFTNKKEITDTLYKISKEYIEDVRLIGIRERVQAFLYNRRDLVIEDASEVLLGDHYLDIVKILGEPIKEWEKRRFDNLYELAVYNVQDSKYRLFFKNKILIDVERVK